MDAICSVGETRTVPFGWGRGENVLAVVALVLVAALAFLALLPEAAFAKTGTNKKACAAYSKMLSKKTMPWAESPGAVSTKKVKFACKDINKDGVKDLVVYRTDGCEATQWYEIYTYINGKVKSLGIYDYLSIYPNKNYFLHSNSGHGYVNYRYYRLTKKGTLKMLASYDVLSARKAPKGVGKVVKKKIDGMPSYLYGFTVGGKKASYSACMKKIKVLERGAKDNLKYVKNTKANRKKYLK